MVLTGTADGPPVAQPAGIAAAAAGAWQAFEAVLAASGIDANLELDAPALLGERAAIAGLSRAGTTSPGGECRLVRARDGWLAVNLARSDDVDLIPAWLEVCEESADPWPIVELEVSRREAGRLECRAATLGMAVSRAVPPPTMPPEWYRLTAEGPPSAADRSRAPVVIDLSSLWAGPLCTHLLTLAGARVIKIESAARPDGARSGPAAFFDLMNAGKLSVSLDFSSDRDVANLARLIRSADIVVEGSRPRALAQLGIDAQHIVESGSGVTWVSITGYGRSGEGSNRVAFGDDAAVAAGLAMAAGSEHAPLFCADAVADPLTGLHAALAALASWHGGGGHLIDIALRDVAAHALVATATEADTPSEAVVERSRSDAATWVLRRDNECTPVAAPRARVARGHAPSLGADTERVLIELGAQC